MRAGIGAALVIAWLSVALGGLAGAAHADPSTPLDPSEVCYRGSLVCMPPYWSTRGDVDHGPPCGYYLGRWVDAYGNRCASGASWRCGPAGGDGGQLRDGDA